jgi:hypothetical protein
MRRCGSDWEKKSVWGKKSVWMKKSDWETVRLGKKVIFRVKKSDLDKKSVW